MSKRIYNFSAGPSVLPLSVLQRARDEMLNYADTGMSVMEMSHRSGAFGRVIERTRAGLRKLLAVPSDYEILFLQGGASLQFAMIPMNLYIKSKPVDVIHTGVWTQKAIGELKQTAAYRLAASMEGEHFRRLPRKDEIRFDPGASYVHLCSNNTVFGTQWKTFPETGNVPLVADMSSDLLSRPVDVSRFGLIFAGTQKNMGPAGVCVVVIRKDLAERGSKDLPIYLQYRTHAREGSLYHTPPTFTIYMVGLMLDWIEREGGLQAIEKKNQEKARMLYDAIDRSGFYYCPVERADRSLMNVVFRIQGDREDLERLMAQEAEKNGLSGLAGHRAAGGLRASIYNAQPPEAIHALIQFMEAFAREHPV